VTIASALIEISEKSIRFTHRMYKEGSSGLVASCLPVGVHLDAQTLRACALPAHIAEQARRLVDA